jgi:MerR family transcriptional regulator, thiopeptide resistance regulator
MPSWADMKTYSISQIGRACGLSRSTLLFYDRLGLLRCSGRTGSGYRVYSDKDLNRLTRIRQMREAGLSLKEIGSVLATGGTPGTRLLEQRMRKTAEDIVNLKNQQRLLAGMLRKVASGKRPRCVDKQMWIEMLKAAGMDASAMNRWHEEFERRSPEGHQEFLLSLGIPPSEAARIRGLSRGEHHHRSTTSETKPV